MTAYLITGNPGSGKTTVAMARWGPGGAPATPPAPTHCRNNHRRPRGSTSERMSAQPGRRVGSAPNRAPADARLDGVPRPR
jgi:hypothetical protein